MGCPRLTLYLLAENRQDHESKRRRIDNNKNGNGPSGIRNASGPSPALGISGPVHNNFAAKADSIGLGAPSTTQSKSNAPAAAQALAGSNRDVVANRAAIRLANMSAAEVLKAELAGLIPVKPSATSAAKVQAPDFDASDSASDFDVPGLGNAEAPVAVPPLQSQPSDESMESPSASRKRTATDVEIEDTQIDAEEDTVVVGENESSVGEEESSYAMVVRADGSVEQVDNVRYGDTSMSLHLDETLTCNLRLYEPGYKERYYQQKFGIQSSDFEFRKLFVVPYRLHHTAVTSCTRVTQRYVEGIAWVLHYYYQGVSCETKAC